MEKSWPPLKECYQFKIGLMHEALVRYPWEDDKYEFDFESYYPPIPKELAGLGKLLDTRKKYKVDHKTPEDCRDCPFCRLYPDTRGVDAPTGPAWFLETYALGEDVLNDPIWDRDPIPCPVHLYEHVWPRFNGGLPRRVTPKDLEDTKKYLNQVRNSRGYDVDCVPQLYPLVPGQFHKVEPGRKTMDIAKRKLDATAIVHINKKTGKVYELEDILKIVRTFRRPVDLYTFTAKVKNDDSAALETFIASILYTAFDNEAVKECLLHPGCNAPGPDHYPDEIIHPTQVPFFYMKRPVPLPIPLSSGSKVVFHSSQCKGPSDVPLNSCSSAAAAPAPLRSKRPREYPDECGGSSVHVEETSPNPEAQNIPSPLI